MTPVSIPTMRCRISALRSEQDDVARPQAPMPSAASRMAVPQAGAGRVLCRGCRRRMPAGGAGIAVGGAGFGTDPPMPRLPVPAYFAIRGQYGGVPFVAQQRPHTVPFHADLDFVSSASIASTCSKKRRLVSSISGGGCLGRRHRIPCGRRRLPRHRAGIRGGDGDCATIWDTRRQMASPAARRVRTTAGTKAAAPDGFDGTQAADAVLRCLRKRTMPAIGLLTLR